MFTKEELSNTKSRREGRSKEGESPLSFFGDFQEEIFGTDIVVSDVETIPSTSDSSPASPSPSISSTGKTDALEGNSLFRDTVAAPIVTEPFPFMTLPL